MPRNLQELPPLLRNSTEGPSTSNTSSEQQPDWAVLREYRLREMEARIDRVRRDLEKQLYTQAAKTPLNLDSSAAIREYRNFEPVGLNAWIPVKGWGWDDPKQEEPEATSNEWGEISP